MKNKKYPYYKVAKPSDLKDLIKYCSENFAERKAFWYKNKKEQVEVSYKQFGEDIEALGTYLINKGYVDKHIAILGENSYEWIVSYFAVVNSGNVVVPIDKEAKVEDVKKQLDFSDTMILLHSDNYSDIAELCEIDTLNFKQITELISVGKQLLSNGDTCFEKVRIDIDKLCAIVFTSGTTSEPKGVMLNHKNLITDAIVSSENLLIPNGTVALLPFYHTFGFMACVICQLLRGYSIFINTSLKRAFDDIKYAQPKHISVVPLLLIAIYNKIWDNVRKSGKEKTFNNLIKLSNFLLKFKIDLRRKFFGRVFEAFGGNLEMIITGGSAIDERYIKGFKDIGIKVINGYGITECSPIVSTMRNKHYAPSSVGAVQNLIEARVVDEEIQIKGPTVFMGYYKNQQATEAAFDDCWFKTGDIGYIDNDGLLYISGRKKNLIILANGKNVSPEELENILLNNISQIKEVVVSGENDCIVAEIYPNYDVENVETEINAKILEVNRGLPMYKQIAEVRFRDTEFSKTTTKKIKRNYGGK